MLAEVARPTRAEPTRTVRATIEICGGTLEGFLTDPGTVTAFFSTERGPGNEWVQGQDIWTAVGVLIRKQGSQFGVFVVEANAYRPDLPQANEHQLVVKLQQPRGPADVFLDSDPQRIFHGVSGYHAICLAVLANETLLGLKLPTELHQLAQPK